MGLLLKVLRVMFTPSQTHRSLSVLMRAKKCLLEIPPLLQPWVILKLPRSLLYKT